MNVISKITQTRSKATKEVQRLARQEAEGKTVDATKAADALTAAGLTESDYGELVSFFEHVVKLEREAAKRAEASRVHGEARSALEAHQAETKRIKEQRAAEFTRLMNEHRDKEAAARQARRAECELAGLKFKHPDRFGEKPVQDLDRYTLTHQGNIIGARDPQAEVLEVDRETFARESERRGRISADAKEKARVRLDWRSIVERGLIEELES